MTTAKDLSRSYFIVVSDKESGPFSFAEIKGFIDSGAVEKSAPIWFEGLAEWSTLAKCAEFFPTTPPPRPAVQNLSIPVPPKVNVIASEAAIKTQKSEKSILGNQSTQLAVEYGDEYYEKEIFPLIAEGKNKTNLVAGFFSFFWFAYKGMWKDWASWMIPYCLLYTAVESLVSVRAAGGIGLAFAITLSKNANKAYYKFYKAKAKKGEPIDDGSVLRGISGAFLFLVFAALCQLCGPEFFHGMKDGIKYANVAAKADIEAIQIGSFGTVEEVLPRIAGADGKISWEAKGKFTYVMIQKKGSSNYLRFTTNQSTRYIMLTEIAVNGRVCPAADLAEQIICMEAILALP